MKHFRHPFDRGRLLIVFKSFTFPLRKHDAPFAKRKRGKDRHTVRHFRLQDKRSFLHVE